MDWIHINTHIKSLIYLSFAIVFLLSCKQQAQKTYNYRNQNYKFLFNAVTNAKPICLADEEKVIFKSFAKLDINEKHLANSNKTQYILEMKKPFKAESESGEFTFYLEEVKDSSFKFRYNSEHFSESEGLKIVDKDKGRLFCYCKPNL